MVTTASLLPTDLYFPIIKHLSPSDLLAASQVCKHWYKIFTCDRIWGPILDKIKSSVADFFSHEAVILYYCPTFQFVMPKVNKGESLYASVLRNRASINETGFSNAVKRLVDTCEIGIPRLHVYRSMKTPFTVALLILIGKYKRARDKPLQFELYFINDRTPDWDDNKKPVPPIVETVNDYSAGYHYHYQLYHWYKPTGLEFTNFFKNAIESIVNYTSQKKQLVKY